MTPSRSDAEELIEEVDALLGAADVTFDDDSISDLRWAIENRDRSIESVRNVIERWRVLHKGRAA